MNYSLSNINQKTSSLSFVQKRKFQFKVEDLKTLSLPKTAPPTLNKARSAKKGINYSRNKTPDIKPFSANPFNANRLSKNKTKDRYIREWAFKKKPTISTELFKEQGPLSQKPPIKPFMHFNIKNEFSDKKNRNPSSRKVFVADFDEEEEDSEFYRKYRNCYVTKADIELQFYHKKLDTKLVDLSKERYKIIHRMNYQKKLFAKKQLLKARSLPGLKSMALLEEVDPEEVKKMKQKKALELEMLNSSNEKINEKIKEIMNETTIAQLENIKPLKDDAKKSISSTTQYVFNKDGSLTELKQNPDNEDLFFMINNSKRLSFANPDISRKKSPVNNSTDDDVHVTTNNRYPVLDKRFRNLITLVKPSYNLNGIRDVSKIIEKNEALKSSNLDSETRKKFEKVKQMGSILAISARKILASGEYITP